MIKWEDGSYNQERSESCNLEAGIYCHIGRWNNPDENEGKWRVQVGDSRIFLVGSLAREAVKKIALVLVLAEMKAQVAKLESLLG